MTVNRPNPIPPRLTGYEYDRLLGRGGYADVFRYRENATDRPVAAKVLHESALDESVRQRFVSELKMMGQLSTHPSIVTLFTQGVAGDGRPYLVMEYCPGANLGQRFRNERISVAEVLATGVSVAGALETAHMSNILHLDIKPANILVNDYGKPVLADFGIAKLRTDRADHITGFSVPWAPPEAFAENPVSVRASDVWGLCALLYSLLAGRSPFEVPGGDNSDATLIDRIGNTRLAPTGRSDVPNSLEAVLAAGLVKAAQSRVESAATLARMLQNEQIRLGIAPTELVVRTPVLPAPAAPDSAEGTRFAVRGIRPTSAQFSAPDSTGANRYASPAPVIPPDPADFTATRGRLPQAPVASPAAPTRSVRPAVIASFVGLVALVGVVAFLALRSPQTTEAPASIRETAPTQRAGADLPPRVPAVTDLIGRVVDSGIEFRWANPAPESGDSYRWIPTQTGRTQTVSEITEPVVVVPASPGRTCIKVSLVRDSGWSSATTEACVP